MSLEVRDLRKSYPTRAEQLEVLRGVELTLQPGETVAIMGPSGSGKSTLLNILGTLDKPTSGSVKLNKVDPFTLDETGIAAFRNQRIGFVFQEHHLLPQCNVLENVLIPTLVHPNLDKAQIEAVARKLLEEVGLSHRLSHQPAELSGGERQRVAIARALILKPALLLADEPTGNLDQKIAREVGELLIRLTREQSAILIAVTHSSELAATFPRTLKMEEGLLVPA
ncbi:ABC transporter ATP-binding protein [Telmatocola sphagniphila]|uniref:ABC transporter ATP-binding protein n=1 Tax=Telmatocola sphagniphila TaxID=1123043 RepID=A0A8E6B8Y3_9BACT|nr:ABC transporter ATP-binding protein [Telmatocola sphagniphila]QVL32570.1 ABC transporter ATP-binding protein [Telmatocola sphagniphila]